MHHKFATAGSDGAFNFWDKDSKQRGYVLNSILVYILIKISIQYLFSIWHSGLLYFASVVLWGFVFKLYISYIFFMFS